MAHKQFVLDEGMNITVYKRRGNRNVRLSVSPDGKIRVSIPAWAPYRTGLGFARKRKDWIMQQQKPVSVLQDGQAIGKSHRLRFVDAPSLESPKSTVRSGEVVVRLPLDVTASSQEAQKAAQKAAVRALRAEAQKLLPQRLKTLAAQHGFEYRSVAVKQLKSRWGSCDQSTNIVLNLYLIQLPWELIDYVLLHELTHTKNLHHGPKFWAAMEVVLPDVKAKRKAMREHQPVLSSPLTATL